MKCKQMRMGLGLVQGMCDEANHDVNKQRYGYQRAGRHQQHVLSFNT